MENILLGVAIFGAVIAIIIPLFIYRKRKTDRDRRDARVASRPAYESRRVRSYSVDSAASYSIEEHASPEVLVSVNYKRTALQFGEWLAVGAAGGLVAQYAPRLLSLID
jgi:hypothetical protein